MKRWYLVVGIFLPYMIYTPIQTQYNSHCPCTEQRVPLYYQHEYKHVDDSEYTSSLLGSILLGASSGFLCRQFEKIALHDLFLLRLINIVIWGHIQNRLLNNVTADLKNQHIKHSADMMKGTAWLVSWISYLLTD